ncbi:MAG: iron-containing alcohol dehydrogenase [Lachnospiraceae bacterium]|nr:iron-containing alcohol dehydrogenase [Lachnospiraceae bacterium]
MKNFIYQNKTKVYFGKGCMKEYLTCILKSYGTNVMLAYGGGSIKKNGIYDELMEYLNAANKTVTEFTEIMPNPTYTKVQEGAALARDKKIDLIIAVGGGSVMDCCKIVSAQAKITEDIWTMEFEHHTYPTDGIPMIFIVTASGTGAEMNNGAVITNEESKIKAGLLGTQADIAMLDPSYTMSLPMKQVISGAFDTLSHCMETYFGKPDTNNLSDDIGEAVMRSVIQNMRMLKKDPMSYEARSELMWASSMGENGILKIGKITDFQAHQIEHQLGAYTDCNHGQGLAVIHPVLYKHIYKDGIERFARFAKNVWKVETLNKTQDEIAQDGIEALSEFIKEMELPTTFREMGITDNSCFMAIADSTNTTAGCCKKLTTNEIYQILMEAF